MSEYRSMVVVTLDSCRFDTAVSVHDLLGTGVAAVKAHSHGTFTLPAHHALFAGYPPTPVGVVGRCRFGLFASVPVTRGHLLWDGDARFIYGHTWLDDVRDAGIRTVGAGGVRWFLHEQLRAGFDEFHFWCPPHSPADQDLPEARPQHFALHHTGVLAAAVAGRARWLLFVNAAETHAPYLAGGDLLLRQRQFGDLRNGKGPLPVDSAPAALMAELRRAQVSALEVAGLRLRRLFAALPRPFDYLVCADHGESLGEQRRWGHVHAAPEVMEVPLWIGSVE